MDAVERLIAGTGLLSDALLFLRNLAQRTQAQGPIPEPGLLTFGAEAFNNLTSYGWLNPGNGLLDSGSRVGYRAPFAFTLSRIWASHLGDPANNLGQRIRYQLSVDNMLVPNAVVDLAADIDGSAASVLPWSKAISTGSLIQVVPQMTANLQGSVRTMIATLSR